MDKNLSDRSLFAKIKLLPRIRLIAGFSAILLIVLALILYLNSNSYKYGRAESLLEEGKYSEAITAFSELGDYKNSKDKIIECNRRILFDYLREKGGYELSNADSVYKVMPVDDRIFLTIILPDKVEFSLSFDMASDNGEFCCKFTPQENISAVSEGTCKISALSTENDLEISYNSGDYTAEQMKPLVNSTCDLLCMNLGAILDKFELGITPFDIGFCKI